jgi:beta-aspartyl-dipeptidase (metallo-type)
MLIRTVRDLLLGGAELQSILPAFTSNVASLLRFHDRGRVAPGCAADLVVLDDGHGIDSVMAAGIWHVRDGRQQVFGQFERQE